MLAVVLAGGDLTADDRARMAVQAADLLIAADSGLKHADALGRVPDLVLGDFDSTPAPTAPAGPAVLTFPRAKDLTDTHLALREALARGATRIVLLGALRGPRLDHGIANLSLLFAPEFARLDLCALDGSDALRAVRATATIHGNPGDLVSLLAFSARVTGITTEGLLYPLHHSSLRRGETRGVSNELVGYEAHLRIERGLLLLVHRDGGDPNRLAPA